MVAAARHTGKIAVNSHPVTETADALTTDGSNALNLELLSEQRGTGGASF